MVYSIYFVLLVRIPTLLLQFQCQYQLGLTQAVSLKSRVEPDQVLDAQSSTKHICKSYFAMRLVYRFYKKKFNINHHRVSIYEYF